MFSYDNDIIIDLLVGRRMMIPPIFNISIPFHDE